MLARLFQQSSIYALGNLLLKVCGLILHVWYLDASYLSQAEYGYLVLLETTAQVGVIITGMGLATALAKFMSDEAYASERGAAPFTVLVLLLVAGSAFVAIVWLIAPGFAEVLLDTGQRAVLIRWMAVYIAIKLLGAVPLMLLRTEERAGWFVGALLLEATLLVGGIYYWLVYQDLGLIGVLRAWTWSAAASTSVLLVAMLRMVAWHFDARLAPRLLRFGVPLALGSLASLFLRFGDQYLLKGFADAAAVGLYGWAYKLGNLISMLFVQSFQMAFLVIGLKALGAEREHVQLHRDAFRHFVVWTGWGVLGLSLLAHDLTALLSDNEGYLDAAGLVLPIALGFMAYGLYYIMLNVLYATEKTNSIAAMVTGTALLNAVLNVALIPPLGALGAALATLASYVALMLIATYYAEQAIPVGYPWRVLLVVLGLIGVLYSVSLPGAGWELAPRISLCAALIVAYPVLIVVLRIYTGEEIRQVIAWGRARLRGEAE